MHGPLPLQMREDPRTRPHNEDQTCADYNPSVKNTRFVLLLMALVVWAGGCKKQIQSNEAVKAGIIKHLSQNAGLSLGAMDIEVSNITFREEEADVLVSFRPKGGDAAAGMQMRYTLEQKGGAWVVKRKADSGNPHSGTSAGQEATPPAPSSDLPPNHPPVGQQPK